MNVLITGASSGIGEALAIACAKRGDTLFFCGRNRERLDAVAAKCRESGAKAVYAETLDVTDEPAVRDWLGRCDAIAPLERIFSNAGVGTGIEDEENIRRTWAINVGGNLNIVLPMLDVFRKRGAGRRQIVITASIAGYAPLATCPMPFFMEADKAARIILKRADRNVGLIAFPWPMRLAVWLLSLCPWRLAEIVSAVLPKKNADSDGNPNCSL